METVDVLTKAVLPMLLGSDGRMPKWLPAVASGALLGAGLGYLLMLDRDRPHSTPRTPLGTAAPSYPSVPGYPTTAYPRYTPPPSILRPQEIREYPLGFVYDPVPGKKRSGKKAAPQPGANIVEVTSRPQVIFRGERLVVPAVTAGNFEIVDIKVGRRSQLASAAALPASTFAENAVGVRLSLDQAMPGQDVSLVVENATPKPQRFIAALIGTSTC